MKALSVDDMMHISSCDELKKEFMDKYSKDFEITGGGHWRPNEDIPGTRNGS